MLVVRRLLVDPKICQSIFTACSTRMPAMMVMIDVGVERRVC